MRADGDVGDSEDAYNRVYENNQFEENKASFGHELAAGGAAFVGFKAFEDHQRKEGQSLCPKYHDQTLTYTDRQASIPRLR